MTAPFGGDKIVDLKLESLYTVQDITSLAIDAFVGENEVIRSIFQESSISLEKNDGTIIKEFDNDEGEMIGLWGYATTDVMDKANRIKLYLYVTQLKSEKSISDNSRNTSRTSTGSRCSYGSNVGNQSKSQKCQNIRFKNSSNTSKSPTSSRKGNEPAVNGTNSSDSVDTERLLMNYGPDFHKKIGGKNQFETTKNNISSCKGSEHNQKSAIKELRIEKLNIFGHPETNFSFLENDSDLKRRSDPLHDRINMPPPKVVPKKRRTSTNSINSDENKKETKQPVSKDGLDKEKKILHTEVLVMKENVKNCKITLTELSQNEFTVSDIELGKGGFGQVY